MKFKHYFLRFAIVIHVFVVASVFVPAKADEYANLTKWSKLTYEYFSTVCFFTVYDDFSVVGRQELCNETWGEIKDLLKEIEDAVSVSVEDSDISKFNRLKYGESLYISPHTAAILFEAQKVYEESKGQFDPTVYPLVDLWGFTPRFNKSSYIVQREYDRSYIDGKLPLPDEVFLNSLRDLVDFGGVVVSGDEENGYRLTKRIEPISVNNIQYEGMLDLGGIAKGYACDLVLSLMHDKGFRYGYFVCGGSSISMLKSPPKSRDSAFDESFEIGIRRPRQGQAEESTFMTVWGNNISVSSSGDYSHRYVRDGIIYCHIIDPRTGYPINTPVTENTKEQTGIAALTIIGDNAAYNDALSTMLCVMGAEEALEYMNKEMVEKDVVMVLFSSKSDKYEVITNISSNRYQLLDGAYEIASEIDENGHVVYTGSIIGK